MWQIIFVAETPEVRRHYTLQGRHSVHQSRLASLAALKEALATRPLESGTMNVTVARQKKKSKTGPSASGRKKHPGTEAS